MLSYRHGFHAGNHADVLKHWALVLVANYMKQKAKPFWYIDTHAAAGVYSLKDDLAKKTQESEGGIQAIWDRPCPPIFDDYLNIIKDLNPHGTFKYYPGSPYFARQCLRPEDKARLFELHPQDFRLLSKNFENDRIVKAEKLDGFTGLKSLLPPTSKRAMVVIDPPYEQEKEYKLVVDSMKESLKRFPSGVYLVWYPLINRNSKQNLSQKMVTSLSKLSPDNFLDVRFWVNGEDEEQGMYGSGLAIINPPWNLPAQLEEGMPFLVDQLGKTASAGYTINSQIS